MDYCRYACIIRLLGLEELIYNLTGSDLFYLVIRPIDFLFTCMVDWNANH